MSLVVSTARGSQVAQSELENFLKGKDYLSETDLTSLAEGEVFGKRTDDHDVQIQNPCVHFALVGAHGPTYAKVLGASNNGRLRFVLAGLDHREVLSVLFITKFLQRKPSYQFILDSLKSLVLAQWKREAGPTVEKATFHVGAMKMAQAKHDGAQKATKGRAQPPTHAFSPSLLPLRPKCLFP